jgi:gamma-glutamylcyclotransferase (GGCT)/AIG2-like uncharacterized protein YtfP
MAKQLLFSYGTLANPEYLELLLKRIPKFTEAVLPGYGLFVHPENGYLFVKPAPRQSVTGKLFEINPEEMKLLDLWEEVPLYQRELLDIQTKQGPAKAFVYTQNQTAGFLASTEIPKSHSSILKDLTAFLNETGHDKLT